MAWKFVQEYVKDGDIIEPSEWRINMNEMLSEINGFLDSDNIGRKSIGVVNVKRNAFTQVYTNDVTPLTSYVFAHEESGWISHGSTINEASSNMINMHIHPASLDAHTTKTTEQYLTHLDENYKRLPSVDFDADQDGLLICEFSGWASWMHQSTNTADLARFKSFTYGPGVGEYNPYSNEIRSSSSVRYGYFAQQTQNFKHLSSYVLCSLWRITVNGQVVAESGPIGCDYQAHPIYLCGTTPITKGSEVIVQLECQFIWYSHGAEQSLPSASFNPIDIITKGKAGAPGAVPDPGRSFRSDCSLNCPTMVVTHRKR
jgi:hypothetical protein